MTKSVWDRLAEMPAEEREKFVKSARNAGATVKSTRKAIGSAIYSRREYSVPETAAFADQAFMDAD